MVWWKGDDKAHGHPKMLAVGLEGIGLFWQAVSWSSAHETDGRVPAYVLPTLAPGVSTTALRKLVDKLCRTLPGHDNPLWHRIDDETYEIHDFLVFNPSHAETLQKRTTEKERLAAKRQAAKAAIVGANTEPTGDQLDGRLKHPGPARPLEDPPNPPQSGGSKGRRQRRSPRANGTSPRQLDAVADAEHQEQRRVAAARQFGAERARDGIHGDEVEARDEFDRMYAADPPLAVLAIEAWREVRDEQLEGVGA